MTARDAQIMVQLFEAGEDLVALARRFHMSAPAIALALAQAFQARADRYARAGLP